MVVNKSMMGWNGIFILSMSLFSLLATIAPVGAKPPLELTAGEKSVAALKEDGMIFMRWGFQSLAIESFRGAMALEDKAKILPSQRDPDVPFNLGLIYLNKGDLKGARGAFERSLEADPTNFKAHYQLALVELQMGDEEMARQRLSLLETAAAQDPQMHEHLEGLMASLDPLPVPQTQDDSRVGAAANPDLAEEDLNESSPTELGVAPSATPSSLASESSSDAPDVISDEVTGVMEMESIAPSAAETGAPAEPEASEPSSGLSRFRRND